MRRGSVSMTGCCVLVGSPGCTTTGAGCGVGLFVGLTTTLSASIRSLGKGWTYVCPMLASSPAAGASAFVRF